jgi:outer membrane autotransporter protein
MDGITSAGQRGAASGLARLARKSAIMGSTAIALAFAASAAQAQCTFPATLGSNVQQSINLGAATLNSIVGTITSLNVGFQTQTSAFIGSPPDPQPGQLGGGSWIRGVAGRTDLSATTQGPVALGPIAIGPVNCESKSRTDYAGFQVGQDIARLNLGGWNLHVGVTGGYSETEGRTGISEARFEVPFAGVYAALTGGGGFYIDGQARWDFYQMSLSDPVQFLRQQRLDGRGFSFASSTGYNIRLGNNFYVEPSAGVLVSRTRIDDLNFIANVAGAGFTVPGTLSFDEIKSTLARAGIRAGTSFTAGGMTLSPYGVVSVFHDFEGKASGNYTSHCGFPGSGCVNVANGAVVPFEFLTGLNSSSVGTFGQYSLGITGQVTNTGWLGYARVDFRKGDNIEGVGMNGGIRYQFSPASRGALSAKF